MPRSERRKETQRQRVTEMQLSVVLLFVFFRLSVDRARLLRVSVTVKLDTTACFVARLAFLAEASLPTSGIDALQLALLEVIRFSRQVEVGGFVFCW